MCKKRNDVEYCYSILWKYCENIVKKKLNPHFGKSMKAKNFPENWKFGEIQKKSKPGTVSKSILNVCFLVELLHSDPWGYGAKASPKGPSGLLVQASQNVCKKVHVVGVFVQKFCSRCQPPTLRPTTAIDLKFNKIIVSLNTDFLKVPNLASASAVPISTILTLSPSWQKKICWFFLTVLLVKNAPQPKNEILWKLK